MPARRRTARRGAAQRGGRTRAEASRLRVLWLLAGAMLLASAIWVRLAYWQVMQHGHLVELADAQHVAELQLPAVRGTISDSQGRPLALNTNVYDITLSPQMVVPSKRDDVANGTAAVLGIPADEVMSDLTSHQPYFILAHRVSKAKSDQLNAMQLPGVFAEQVTQRTYLPGGTADTTLAAGLLGFVDYAGNGQRGIEQYYNPQLGGEAGEATLFRDSAGRPIAATMQNQRRPVNGTNVTLTLDSDVQYAAEQAIADGVKANHAQSGSVLIMDTHTGGIVAWASTPGYNANSFNQYDPSRTQDPIASGLYEPGSVMKVVTLAGAMDAGAITPDTTINDPGYVDVDGWTIRDWNRSPSGQVTMTRVLENSLNVGAVKAMQAEGRTNYLKYLRAFGFGQPSGVGVGEEASRPLAPDQQWSDAQLATSAFGQGIAVNMVQMLAAVNTVGNGGVYVRPHVIAGVGKTTVTPSERRVITPQTAQEMNGMMRSVVQHGSGRTARIKGFELDETGKTGTSQMPEAGGYSNSHVWASYVGFLPAENPRFTMLVVVNRPDNGSSDANEGYYVSAPIWKRLAEQMILQWHISPEQLPPTAS